MYETDEPGVTRQAKPDPHEYCIRECPSVDERLFDQVVAVIRTHGYKGAYSPPYAPERRMVNDYLEVAAKDGERWIYWFIRPNMLNRQRAEHRQHQRLEQPHQAAGQLTLMEE